MCCSAHLSAALPVVINTRPIERAAPLTSHLQAAGFTVVDIPMLALQLRPTAAADIDIMRHWLAGDYQALIIVSPTAAASGLAAWQTLESAKLLANSSQANNSQVAAVTVKLPSHVIAVGEATAAVLHSAELPITSYDVRQPLLANNEGMLAMPEIERLQAGDKLLVWRGLGGRRLLVDTLQARGVHIDSIAWYQRTMPDTAHAQYQHWQQQFHAQLNVQLSLQAKRPKPVVVISSATAFEHWSEVVARACQLFSAADKDSAIAAPLTLADFSYLVLGERLANMVAAQQLSYWRVEDLAPATILAAIQSEKRQSKN